jgi:hypothetical protein
MVTYGCPRCGYNTKKRSNYELHANRKTLCEPLISNVVQTITNYAFKNNRGDMYVSQAPSEELPQATNVLNYRFGGILNTNV